MTPIQLTPFRDVALLAPVILTALGAMAVLLADLFLPPEKKNRLPLVGAAALGLALLALRAIDPDTPRTFFGDCLRLDRVTHLAGHVIIAGSLFILLVSPRFLRDRAIPAGEYYSLILFATMAMLALAASNELLTLFLNVEVLAISLYVLAGIERDNLRSTEAAFKYFLLGSYSAAFLLFGATLMYGAAGTTGFNEIAAKCAAGEIANPGMMAAGFVLVLAGFASKLTLAPFHMYAPDLYAGAPTPVAGLIATGSKVASLAALVTLVRIAAGWKDLPFAVFVAVTGLSVLSITVGNLGAILQPNLKRMLAYSGVAHGGYALIPLAAALHDPATGGKTPDFDAASNAVVYYMLAYALTTALPFGVAATLGAEGDNAIDRYEGLSRRSPLLAAVMALALLSLTGVPITAGFVGKVYLFSEAVKEGLYALAAFGVAASVASAYYYLRVIVKMYMAEPAAGRIAQIDGANVLALAAGAAGVLFFAIFPTLYFWI